MPQGSHDFPPPGEPKVSEYLRIAVEGSSDAIIVTTAGLTEPEPTILYANPAFERMTGYSSHEVLGHSPRLLQGPRTDRTVLARMREELQAGRSFQGSTANYRKDGSVYEVEWHISSVRDEKGKVTSWVAIQRDVTEAVRHDRDLEQVRRLLLEANERLEVRVSEATAELRRSVEDLGKANEGLRIANEELAANNRDMATFTYTVSHDLRQPARAIVANAHWLMEDFGPSLPPDARALLDRQSAAALRMGTLVDDLLRMARLGRTVVERERLNLTALVKRVWEEFHADHGGAELVVQEGMESQASGSLVGVVYQNLLGNALKFRASRPLVVEAGRVEDGVFYVRDNGVGFDQRYAERIFAPFERLHSIDVEGSGFGLHNAQRITEQHGGHMWAEGKEGEGATFFFTLG